MPAPTLQDRIHEKFVQLNKEYEAFDRTLDALSSVRFVLEQVSEIRAETHHFDFRPRLASHLPNGALLTPDGLFVQRVQAPIAFVLELKTSWDDDNIGQFLKYGKSPAYLACDAARIDFPADRCVLVGYQNPPNEQALDRLFDAWRDEGVALPLVISRYSLEQAPTGHRIYWARIPYSRNGVCPGTAFGKAINATHGMPVSTDRYRAYRSKFHKTNDQTIDSYAAVIWWTQYARHYLSDDQRADMAERGRLRTPLHIRCDSVYVPTIANVDVSLARNDIKRALEFLRQAGLAKLVKGGSVYEIMLKEDRYIRFLKSAPVDLIESRNDIATKILHRWATNTVKNPAQSANRRGPRRKMTRRDTFTRPLFPD